MDPQRLKILYERVIAQDEYPGNVCPTEHKLAELVMGALSAVERRRMDEHLLECTGCREAADELRAAAQWFKENEAELFAGLAERAAAAGVEPWSSCLRRDLLQLFLAGAIPETKEGARLHERIEAHLDECAACRQVVTQAQAALAAMLVIQLADLRERESEKAAAAHAMLLAIKTMAIARGARRMRAMPGFRGKEEDTLSALVLDQGGKLVVGEDGDPERADFHRIRAKLESDGHFVLELATDDRSFWESPESTFVVSVSLQHENRRLVLPPEKIFSDGHVTIVGNLPPGVEIRDFPHAAIMLTVMKREAPEGT